ncbi:hypothetical protein M422DRAFT_257159 [Sphaerobolus stellatus SS14]|uniref:Uncharacterized protein n=1 Tax=Sphaerobolus stellatus (strain SS14) TaxID=990650 RepID=A0A0C9UAC8_SPHS4|nr:hypothetical protein M422DRAFT_257159 [Sphaerobolus stellatus SS14]
MPSCRKVITDLRAYAIALRLFLDSTPNSWPPAVFPIPSPTPHFLALSAHLSSKYANVRGIRSLSASSSLTSSSKRSMLACAWSHSIRIAKPAEKSEELEIYRLAHYSWHTRHAYVARMKDFYEVADVLVALQELSIQYLFSDTPESLAAPPCLLFPSLQYRSIKAPSLCIPLQVARFWQLPVLCYFICTASNSQDPYLPESWSNFGSKLKILGLGGTFRTPTPYLQFSLLCLSLDNCKFKLHADVPVPDDIEVNITMYSPSVIMFR